MRARALLAMLLAFAPAMAHAAPGNDGLTVERVVLLMRHGVRPPTKAPPMPEGVAADPWPDWPVAPGWLTPHGAQAIRLLGRGDRDALVQAGVLPPDGCPASGAVAVASDSDQRTIATGDAYLAGLAPGCAIANAHRAQDDPDPLFSPIGEAAPAFDAGKARAAVVANLGPGGVAAAEAAQRDALTRIDRIYCGGASDRCGVTHAPSSLLPAEGRKRPGLAGALDLGSTAAQILLLEYADGRPMSDVGWGRATREDIVAVGALHAAEFAILARPLYVAAHNVAPIAQRMLAALTARSADAPRLTVLVGHDTNVANLGGLLDLHWQADGFARDDPPPGGALGFELLRDRKGRAFVRAVFRSQSIDQMRGLTPPGGSTMTALAIPGCAREAVGDACPLTSFVKLVESRLGTILAQKPRGR